MQKVSILHIFNTPISLLLQALSSSATQVWATHTHANKASACMSYLQQGCNGFTSLCSCPLLLKQPSMICGYAIARSEKVTDAFPLVEGSLWVLSHRNHLNHCGCEFYAIIWTVC